MTRRLAYDLDGTPHHLLDDTTGRSVCGLEVDTVAGQPSSFTCSACYMATPLGWRAHLRLIARDLNDPRRDAALAALDEAS